MLADDDLWLKCREDVGDDGNPFPDSPGEPGLGEQFLRSCSLEWNRQRQDGMNILTLAIPVTVVSAEAPSL